MTLRSYLGAVFFVAALIRPASAEATFGLARTTLPNGLEVVVDRVGGAPGVAAVVAVKTGSADDEPFTGLAHYLEHVLFKGTEKYPPGTTHAAIESAGGEFNAFTSQDYTAYWVEIPKERLDLALDVLAEATLRPTFPAEEIERERTVIQEERRRRADRPEVLRWDRLSELAFRVHPYGRPGVGTETDIERLTREDLVAFHAAHYQPRKMVLIVSGDVSPETVFAAAQRYFASGRPHTARGRTSRRPSEPPWEEPRTVVEPAPTARAYWMLAALGPSGRDAEANAALDVAAEIVAGGRAASLRKRLVDDLEAADECSAWWSTSRDPDLFVVSGVSEPIDLPLVEKEVRRALARLAATGPEGEEIDRAVRRIETRWATENESPRARAFRLAFHWSIQDLDEAARYLDRVRSVTAEAVREAVRALRPENALFFALSPTPASPARGETSYELPNGVRVLLRPNPALPVVAVSIGVLAGEAEEETAGLASLVAELLPRGAAGKTADELARAWEGSGVSVTAGAEPDFLVVSAVSRPEAAGLAFRAASDLVLSPDFPEGEVETYRARRIRTIRAKRDRPFDLALDRLYAEALAGMPYATPLEGTETSVARIRREDLVAFHAEYFVPARMIVAVEGNFDAAAVAKAVDERFRTLPAGAPRAEAGAPSEEAPPRAEKPSAPAEPLRTVTVRRPGAAQAVVVVGYPAPEALSPNYPAYKLANAVLGGASQARLFRHLREEAGLAYAVGSFYPSLRGRSLLVAYLGTDAANLSAETPVERRIAEVLARAARDLTAEELEAAREKAVGDFLLDHATSARRAWYRIFFEGVGRGATYDDRYIEELRAVRLDEVRAALEKILASPPVVVRVVPEVETDEAPR